MAKGILDIHLQVMETSMQWISEFSRCVPACAVNCHIQTIINADKYYSQPCILKKQ